MSQEKELIGHIRRLLDESAEDIEAATAARLALARSRALQEETKRRIPWRWPALGLATAAAGILAFMMIFRAAPPPLTAEHREVLEIITSGQNLELYRNLEFYAWLAKNREVLKGG